MRGHSATGMPRGSLCDALQLQFKRCVRSSPDSVASPRAVAKGHGMHHARAVVRRTTMGCRPCEQPRSKRGLSGNQKQRHRQYGERRVIARHQPKEQPRHRRWSASGSQHADRSEGDDLHQCEVLSQRADAEGRARKSRCSRRDAGRRAIYPEARQGHARAGPIGAGRRLAVGRVRLLWPSSSRGLSVRV